MKYSKKSLGQNFLIDKNIIKKIVNSVNLKDKDIIEIGPGKAALTNEILKQNPRSLKLVEKDNYLAQNLKSQFLKNKKIKIYNNDILDFDIEKIMQKNCIIFGNLPYNISSQIFVKILKYKRWPPKFTDLIFMFQKELGDKIIGKFQSSNYGRLSILSDLRLKVFKKFNISPNCFFPRPKITSSLIHFKPKNSLAKIKSIENLEKVTNIIFSNKRKMINKNINKILSKNEIDKIANLNTSLRPSEIKPETYYKIVEIIEKR